MAQFSNSILVASAGLISITPGSPVSFTVSWGDNISPYRWSRVWPAILGASDEANHQSVTISAEGSQWDTPGSNSLAMTIVGNSDLGGTVTAEIQVMASQADTF